MALKQALTHNARQVGWSGMDGRGDALQLCGQKKGGRYYLYVGHFWSGGVSILDVTTPSNPKVVHYLQCPTPNTWHINLQVADALLMVANERYIPGWAKVPPETPWEAGVQFYDVSEPTKPRKLAHARAS